MQSMLWDSLFVQIATHEQRHSLTQFFGDLGSSTHRVKVSTLICYSPVACVALTCSFLSWCVATAEPRVLILGHSFIRRLHEFVSLPSNALREDFDITTPMNLRWHGIGGRTVVKVIRWHCFSLVGYDRYQWSFNPFCSNCWFAVRRLHKAITWTIRRNRGLRVPNYTKRERAL